VTDFIKPKNQASLVTMRIDGIPSLVNYICTNSGILATMRTNLQLVCASNTEKAGMYVKCAYSA